MPYPGHAYVSLDGDWTTSDGAAELWQFGIRVFGNTAAPQNGYLAGPQAYADQIAPGIGTWFAAAANHMATSARLRMLKVNNINPAGKYADPQTHQHDYGAGITGGADPVGSQITSVVVGFLGDTYSRGPAARGRVYPVNGTYGMNGAFTTLPASRDSAIAAIKALLALLRINEPDGGHLVTPAIVSSQSRYQSISRLTADTIIDVQRRRKNRATGVRATVAAL